jgi:hypothetical protein
MKRKLTISEIRSANQAAGFYTFDRKTLRFFGETMRNWKAGPLLPDGRQTVYRSGGKAGSKTFVFNPSNSSVLPFRNPEPSH